MTHKWLNLVGFACSCISVPACIFQGVYELRGGRPWIGVSRFFVALGFVAVAYSFHPGARRW